MGMEFGKVHPANLILANGSIVKQKDTEFMFGKITISTKGSGIKILDMEMVAIFSIMEMFM